MLTSNEAYAHLSNDEDVDLESMNQYYVGLEITAYMIGMLVNEQVELKFKTSGHVLRVTEYDIDDLIRMNLLPEGERQHYRDLVKAKNLTPQTATSDTASPPALTSIQIAAAPSAAVGTGEPANRRTGEQILAAVGNPAAQQEK